MRTTLPSTSSYSQPSSGSRSSMSAVQLAATVGCAQPYSARGVASGVVSVAIASSLLAVLCPQPITPSLIRGADAGASTSASDLTPSLIRGGGAGASAPE